MVCHSRRRSLYSMIHFMHPSPIRTRTATAGTRSDLSDQFLLLVIHTLPEGDFETDEAVGRIISARKATARERKVYEEGGY
jgi:uncharacterized protein